MTTQTRNILLKVFTEKYTKAVAEDYLAKGTYSLGYFYIGGKAYQLGLNFEIIKAFVIG